MTKKEKEEIERKMECFMVSLAYEYPDIAIDDIFAFAITKASTFFVAELDKKYKLKALRKFYPENAKKIDAIFKKAEK